MKVPKKFDGTYAKLRTWWEMMKDYVQNNEPYPLTEDYDSLHLPGAGSLVMMFVSEENLGGGRCWGFVACFRLRVR